jgi:hypothetical protein
MRFRWVGKEGTDEWGCRAFAVERDSNLELVGALVNINMAKVEGWYGKSGSKWKTMPEQMLQYRAGAFWCRTYAPEIALGMHTSEEIQDTPATQQVVQSVTATVSSSIVDVTPTPPEPKPRKKKEAEAIAIVEPPATPAPEPAPEIVEVAPLAPAPLAPAPVPAPEPELETVESTLTAIGITYPQLAKLAGEMNWWPEADSFPMAVDLPTEVKQWIIRNRRGIGRAVQKAGGGL